MSLAIKIVIRGDHVTIEWGDGTWFQKKKLSCSPISGKKTVDLSVREKIFYYQRFGKKKCCYAN